ncbi:MAG: hypothetical protein ACXVFN_06530 [Solirubrobacteraceae bacterium]
MTPPPDRRDPRERPVDPAGTQPRHDPASLLPATRERDVVESSAVEDGDGDLLPERKAADGVDAPPAPGAQHGHSAHAPRFQFLTGALIAVAVAAVAGLAVVVFGNPVAKSEPAWSRWKPSASGVDGAQQIAARVGAEYRDGGAQLVDVQTNGLAFKGVQLTVALRQSAQQGGNIQVHDDKGVLYQLCGLGPNCSIDRGKPSRRRAFLLKREGLELALYSLHYLGVKQVVVLLPPPPGRAQTVAMYFRQGDVKTELARPLTASLAPRAPTVSTVTHWPDAGLVQQTTSTNYLFSLMGSSFNDRAFLVLDPYSPAADDRLQKQLAQQQKQALAAAAGATGSSGG